MELSPEEKLEMDDRYCAFSIKAKLIEENMDKMPYSGEEFSYVWQRLTQIRAMSEEEFRQEIEAEYLLLEYTRFNEDNTGFKFVPFRKKIMSMENYHYYLSMDVPHCDIRTKEKIMGLTPIEKKDMENRHMAYSVKARLIDLDKDMMPYFVGDFSHVWRRLSQIRAMSKEALMQEIVADYLLFEYTRLGVDGFEFIPFTQEDYDRKNIL
jgi:hypothetical protein